MVRVRRVSLASADSIPRQIAEWRGTRVGERVVDVVVAGRVTRQARDDLRAAGWGWLDLRGHLHLVGAGTFIDTAVPALSETESRSEPLAGDVGVEVAALLLLHVDQGMGVRQVAAALGRAPSSVSQVTTRMRTAGLIDQGRRPAVPELFWELASHWQRPGTDLRSVPLPGAGVGERSVNDSLRLGLEDVSAVGWALADTVAAARYGAPVNVRSDHPPDFYVPDASVLRRAVQILGRAEDHDSRAATVRIAPVPFVCFRRYDFGYGTWPLADPLFVALDLAQDPGRGRDILNGWAPPKGAGHRVW